jgi:tetratricopeptide (TPR) repeat protein
MIDDRARRLAQLRQAYESGILDEDTYRAAIAALGVEAGIQAAVEGPGAAAQDSSAAAGERGVAVRGDVQGGVSITEVHYHGIEEAKASTTPRLRVYQNLPQPDYGTFIGRDEELARTHQLLLPYPRSRYHIITIDGIGGIGKSSLALEAACHYLHAYDSLPEDERFDAIIWTSAKRTILTANGIVSRRADLRNLDDIYTTIGATLERDDISQTRLEERSAVVARALARQRTLLIVDNLETVDDEQVMAFIREVPDPTKVIVTTRQRIAVAYPMRLVEMPWEDAQGLIAQECEKKGVALTGEQARQLYDRTGGVPLALVWSISRVALGENVQYVLQRLSRRDSDVARFCFEGVVQHLRDNESYKLLVASALFAQDAPRGALGYVAGIEDELSCEDGLVTLERMSLLNRQADRFSLLPLTRSYLDHELEQAPDFAEAAFERMLAYYLQTVAAPEEMRSGVPYWDGLLNAARSPSLRAEWANIAHVLRQALHRHRYAEALDLFLPIVPLMNGWGLWDERLKWSREMCQVANELNDASEAWLWIDAVGWVLLQRQQFSECIQALDTGKYVARRFNLTDALLQADAIEARLYASMGDVELARQRVESALEQVDLDSVLERGSPVRRLVTSWVVGAAIHLSWSERDFVQAKELLERELELRGSTGQSQAPTLTRLGLVSLELDDVAAAEEFLAQASVVAGAKEVAWINHGRALIAEQRGKLQEARRLGALALEQFSQLGIESGIQSSRELLARLRG